jgi:hypothetical protein
MVTVWPEPVSAKKPMPERVPVAPVQETVHSMWCFLMRDAGAMTGRWRQLYYPSDFQATERAGGSAPKYLLRCNKKARTI